jgi:hypothetical protein
LNWTTLDKILPTPLPQSPAKICACQLPKLLSSKKKVATIILPCWCMRQDKVAFGQSLVVPTNVLWLYLVGQEN